MKKQLFLLFVAIACLQTKAIPMQAAAAADAESAQHTQQLSNFFNFVIQKMVDHNIPLEGLEISHDANQIPQQVQLFVRNSYLNSMIELFDLANEAASDEHTTTDGWQREFTIPKMLEQAQHLVDSCRLEHTPPSKEVLRDNQAALKITSEYLLSVKQAAKDLMRPLNLALDLAFWINEQPDTGGDLPPYQKQIAKYLPAE